jgi:hypothetical protein
MREAMSNLNTYKNDEEILAEFFPAVGVRAVSFSPDDIVEKSKGAIEDAMRSMRGMAKKTAKAIAEMPVSEQPNIIAISFGLKLDSEGNAIISKTGLEASININMTWVNTTKEK